MIHWQSRSVSSFQWVVFSFLCFWFSSKIPGIRKKSSTCCGNQMTTFWLNCFEVHTCEEYWRYYDQIYKRTVWWSLRQRVSLIYILLWHKNGHRLKSFIPKLTTPHLVFVRPSHIVSTRSRTQFSKSTIIIKAVCNILLISITCVLMKSVNCM